MYISGTIAYAIFLAINFIKDKDTPKTDVNSWKILLLACLIWPIAIPISYYEIRKKKVEKISAMKFLSRTEGELR